MNYQPDFSGYDLFYLHIIILVDGVLGDAYLRGIDMYMRINLPHKLGSMTVVQIMAILQ